MKRIILMSIRPEHLVKILNGEKTFEIRKTIPKDIELPCDVYLYCSKAKPYLYTYEDIKENSDWEWEKTFFVSKKTSVLADLLNGKVVAKFTPNKIDEMKYDKEQDCYWASEFFTETASMFLKKCCLTKEQFRAYGNNKTLYAYHIDNLTIFDNPKELREFSIFKRETIDCGMDCPPYTDWVEYRVYKAPQSWQHAWVKE